MVKEWTGGDSDIALGEGWDVFLIDSDETHPAIQRFDEAEVFEDDDGAVTFVRRRAAEGSALHQKALERVAPS